VQCQCLLPWNDSQITTLRFPSGRAGGTVRRPSHNRGRSRFVQTSFVHRGTGIGVRVSGYGVRASGYGHRATGFGVRVSCLLCYAVGIFLCPAAGLKSRGNTAFDRTFSPGRGIVSQTGNAFTECLRLQANLSYAVGIFLCPAAGSKSCGNTALNRTFQPDRGIVWDSGQRPAPLTLAVVVDCSAIKMP